MIEDYFIEMTWKQLTGTTQNDNYENDEQFTTTTINGYIGSRTPMEINVGGKWTSKNQYKFYSDEEPSYGDIIVYNGKNYRIISDPQNTVNMGHHYKSFVEHLTNIT